MTTWAREGVRAATVSSTWTRDGIQSTAAVVDTMTEVGGDVNLENHVGETGATWEVSSAGALVVASVPDAVRLAAASTSARAWPSGAATLASTDMAIEASVYHATGSDDDLIAETLTLSLYVRWNRTHSNGYRLAFAGVCDGFTSALPGTFILYRVDGGVEVAVATAVVTWDSPATTTVRVEALGSTITVSYNGVAVIAYTVPAVSATDLTAGFGLADTAAGLVHGLILFLTSITISAFVFGADSNWDQP